MKKSKIMIIGILTAMLATSSLGFSSVAKAETSVNGDILYKEGAVTLEDGASVRIGTEYGQNGLRYKLTVDKNAYDTLKNNNVDVTYGILIAPESYYQAYPFNDDKNLKDKYVNSPTPGENKYSIIDLNTKEMTLEGDRYSYYGSVVDIKVQNINMSFHGVGYARYKLNNDVKYVFSTNESHVRSMFYVAGKAINSGKESAEKVKILKDDYMNNVCQGYTFETINETTCILTSYKGTKENANITNLPGMDQDGREVVRIQSGWGDFIFNQNLPDNLVIPTSVESFGPNTFQYTNIKTLSWENNKSKMNTLPPVFHDTSLERVDLPEQIVKFEGDPFSNTDSNWPQKLTTVILRANCIVTRTNGKSQIASWNDSKLKSIYVPASVLDDYMNNNEYGKHPIAGKALKAIPEYK